MSRFHSHLTYANVISTLALILVVGGGSAIAASQFAKESIGGRAIKKESIGPAKLTKAAKATLVGPAGADGPKGATGAAGSTGPAGPAGSARAYGETADNNGSLTAARSKNATVRHADTGTYCIAPGTGIDPAGASLLVTADYANSGTNKTIAQIRSTNIDCDNGELEVRLWNDGVPIDAQFSFLIP